MPKLRDDRYGDAPKGRLQTTMRLQEDVIVAADKEADQRGWSRTKLFEQVLSAYLRGRGYKVKLKKQLIDEGIFK